MTTRLEQVDIWKLHTDNQPIIVIVISRFLERKKCSQ